MFDTICFGGVLPARAPREEGWFDPAWLDQAPEPPDTGQSPVPVSECAPPLVVSVIVPITTLLGLDDYGGELVGHGPIFAGLAREIAAQGTWRRLLTDLASGTLYDHGRTTYTPPTGLADFVRARDLRCRFPVDQHADGRITWTTPTGHTATSHPYDYRPDPHPPPGDDPPPF
ncbi:MAG: hypothetical protein ACRDTH_14330 [Pseudonocardiaceae bacterium]